MEKFEVLAGGEFSNAVNILNLTSAKCTYRYHPNSESYREDYQVWELSKDDFDRICSIDDDSWQEDWGWWRHCVGSNLGGVNHDFIINGKKIMAWDGFNRISWEEECQHDCGDRKRGLCNGESFEECFGERSYPDLIAYLNNEVGASNGKNVCACAVDLARQNSMTLSELFREYLG